MTKVSVIMPIYNVELYLGNCIRSIVDQTLSDIEIICINDGSTDNSLKIIKKYETLLGNRLKIISQPNKGVSEARNLGLKVASGDFVIFIDPDDWIEANMLEEMYERAKFNNLEIIECDIIEHIENRTKIRKRRFKLNYRLWFKFNILHTYNYCWRDIKNTLFKIRAYSVNRLYKRSFLLENEILYPNFGGEDFYFILHAMLSAQRVGYINQCFYHYRKRKDSLSSGNGHSCPSNNTLSDYIKYVENILNKLNIYNLLKDQFDNWVISLCFSAYESETIKARLQCQEILSPKQQVKLEEKIQNNNNNILECLFSVKSEVLQRSFYKKVSLFGYRWYFKIK